MNAWLMFGLAAGIAGAAPRDPPRSLAPPAQAEMAGTVRTVQGEVFILREGQKTPASVGTRLFPRDVVQTGGNGAVGIVLRDDAAFSLGPSSEVALRAFAFQPQHGLFTSVLRMAKGTLVYLTGRIARLAPGAARVEVPEGIVAIRGTKILVEVEP